VSTPRQAPPTNTVVRLEKPPFNLRYEPDESSWTARENLTDILKRELRGPANGPEEILDGVPDAAYMVGRIAPARVTTGRTSRPEPDDEDATDIADVFEPGQSRGVPAAGTEETGADASDDGSDDKPQQRGLMAPSSMGLRCQIPLDMESFTVTASWGVYEPIKEERAETGDDKPRSRRYKRTQISIEETITVADLYADEGTTVHLKDEVVLRINRRDNPEDGCRLIELALCNARECGGRIPVSAWLYQTKLVVEAGGVAAFLPVTDAELDTRTERDPELNRLKLQYRHRLEFALGRICSVDWAVAEGARRATSVWTTWLPISETPQTTAEEIGDALLDMMQLADATADELRSGLTPIIDAYTGWLDGQQRDSDALPEHLRAEGHKAVDEARKVQRQLAAGLEHLLNDSEALRCFGFMNRVMADQRIHSQVAELRAANPDLAIDQARASVLTREKPHSWRTFQLAFVLMQLPMLTNPAAPQRSSSDLAAAQLLFFPTGGGKTEAYLGLAAYTFAIRRRQGVVASPDGPLDGNSGIAVLMRYTLRLLTSQQFQRATTLMCAAEVARMADPDTWGAEPFRIGLWVGTDVSPKRYDEAKTQLEKRSEGRGYRLTVLQIQRCPWCGNKIDANDVVGNDATRRVYVYCSDQLADCPFSQGGSAGEGLPVLTVDEEIYRLVPAFLIATVDKFARLAREGEAAALFGYVSKRCERHGFVHPDYRYCDIKDGSKHPNANGTPAAAVRATPRLRPPDLIIQDELHLITGSLGTTVGLFEVAIELMTAWRDADGNPVRPLVIASTATARNAAAQVRALYGRGTTIFPPQVLDAGKTFFSKEEPVSRKYPGRRYIGVSTTGTRMTSAEIRVAEILMAGGQLLLDRSGVAADPYMALVGYFSATRELAGMARYMGDDIQTALAKGQPWSSLPRRFGTDFSQLHVAELTARVASADITATLDQMGVSFDPEYDSTDARRKRAAISKEKQQQKGKGAKEESAPPTREVNPYDAILATSMLQVGVDVTRLGLMLVVGQPKNTAEYIQASSRVGRDAKRPGLVVALGNWARPRDLAHFEQFRHYHETFYARVEALSVTPFSATSMDRGLDSVLVSAARVLQAARSDGLSPEFRAGVIESELSFAENLVEMLTDRVRGAAGDVVAERARIRLGEGLAKWRHRRQDVEMQRKALIYERVRNGSAQETLLMSAEEADSYTGGRDSGRFVVANSMREVQPEITLLVSPTKENLLQVAASDPTWNMPEGD